MWFSSSVVTLFTKLKCASLLSAMAEASEAPCIGRVVAPRRIVGSRAGESSIEFITREDPNNSGIIFSRRLFISRLAAPIDDAFDRVK